MKILSNCTNPLSQRTTTLRLCNNHDEYILLTSVTRVFIQSNAYFQIPYPHRALISRASTESDRHKWDVKIFTLFVLNSNDNIKVSSGVRYVQLCYLHNEGRHFLAQALLTTQPMHVRVKSQPGKFSAMGCVSLMHRLLGYRHLLNSSGMIRRRKCSFGKSISSDNIAAFDSRVVPAVSSSIIPYESREKIPMEKITGKQLFAQHLMLGEKVVVDEALATGYAVSSELTFLHPV